MPRLADSFLTQPIAHRGLHDLRAARQENSRAAFRAAMEEGYGIELDLQLSSDGEAMVFHDYDLGALSEGQGAVRAKTAAELAATRLKHGTEGIPTLAEVLELVGGRVPLLIELKDQDGALGPDVGPLEARVAELVRDYDGDVGLMSFNPHSVAALSDLVPDLPRGLVTEDFAPGTWPVPEHRLVELRRIEDLDRVGATFISHSKDDLASDRVAEIKDSGRTILTWTIRSQQEEDAARNVADNITFEDYLPVAPG